MSSRFFFCCICKNLALSVHQFWKMLAQNPWNYETEISTTLVEPNFCTKNKFIQFHITNSRMKHIFSFGKNSSFISKIIFYRAVVEALLAAGVNVNTRTAAGTAMHEAALCGKMEVVRTLLDHGIDLSIRDSRHNTVLDLLSQFPEHVTHDIMAVIKRKLDVTKHCESVHKNVYDFYFKGHRLSSGMDSDADSENYPPHSRLYNDSLGSPYDYRHCDDISPGDSCSPTRNWQFYHRPREEDRRMWVYPLFWVLCMMNKLRLLSFQKLQNFHRISCKILKILKHVVKIIRSNHKMQTLICLESQVRTYISVTR